MTFNWQELSRDSILSWAVTHALSTKQVTEAHERGIDWTSVDIDMQINGFPVDGEKLLVDMWDMLQKQFDKAVKEDVDERFRELDMEIEDVLDEVFEAAKAKLRGESPEE